MMMSYFLILEVPPSLGGSVNVCSLGGTPSPKVQGLEGKAPQGPSMGFCTKMCFGHFQEHISTCDGMRQ